MAWGKQTNIQAPIYKQYSNLRVHACACHCALFYVIPTPELSEHEKMGRLTTRKPDPSKNHMKSLSDKLFRTQTRTCSQSYTFPLYYKSATAVHGEQQQTNKQGKGGKEERRTASTD